MPLPALDVKGLEIAFNSTNETNAVDGINFQIHRGKLLAIVGESGSGKTVTALSILKLLQSKDIITKGEILFSPDGSSQVNLLDAPENQMQSIRGNKISMIFQEPMSSLNPLMTCGDQVIEAIRVHTKLSYKTAKEKTIKLFQTVDLPDPENILKKFPHQLSGGQKQRVMIAMAMSCNPAVLIADEPTTALDVTVQKKILALIKELQVIQNMAVIFITHDLNLVASIADDIIVMLKGRIIEYGSVAEIFKTPKHPYTKALLACRPNEESKGHRLLQTSDFLSGKTNHDQDEITPLPLSSFPKNNEPIIEVKDLVVDFPVKKNVFGKTIRSFTAVDHISFNVYKGETLGIVGESGSGKTTVGRSLVKLIQPTSGKILFNGHDVAEMNEPEIKKMRQQIQIIFQDPYGSLNPRMTIGHAIEEPLKVHGLINHKDERRQKVLHLLQKVDLKPEHFNRYPHQFSGGQRQRICIARAIAVDPGFIICDESVSALDVSVQAQILNLLNDLKHELGFTCVFISHDLAVVRYISDRIMVMEKGRIVEIGETDQVYFDPQNVYTKELISSIPKVPYHN